MSSSQPETTVGVGALERGRSLKKARLDPFEARRDVGRKRSIGTDAFAPVPSVAGNRSTTTTVPAATSRGPTSSRIGTPRSSQWLNLNPGVTSSRRSTRTRMR